MDTLPGLDVRGALGSSAWMADVPEEVTLAQLPPALLDLLVAPAGRASRFGGWHTPEQVRSDVARRALPDKKEGGM